MKGATLTRADLCEAVHEEVGLTRQDCGELVERVLELMAVALERAGADFLVMVCNTAHAFLPDIRQATRLPFISIIDGYDRRLRGYGSIPIGGLMGYSFAEHVWLDA